MTVGPIRDIDDMKGLDTPVRNRQLAFDRSMRRYDADGHLHVEQTNICKANVCPYYGREIPDYKRLGLHPDRIYNLYRHPDELKKAAHTFAGKPLLMHHVPITADEPATELVIGATGSEVTFDGLYLKSSLSVWRADAIELIDSREQEQLSPGYRYRADMTPGRAPDGVAYDGIMRDIACNHVATVEVGRQGSDVVVADTNPPEFIRMKFGKFLAALVAAFPAIKAEEVAAMDAALGEDMKRVQVEHCLSEDEMKAALDAYAKDRGIAVDAMTEEDKTEAFKRAAKDKSPARQPPGMDEAAVTARVAQAVADATKDMVSKADADKLALDAAAAARAETHALYTARKAVEATVGVVAHDTAEAVYRFALDHLKVDHKDVAASALAALYDASVKAKPAGTPDVAQDAAVAELRANLGLFLGLSHIRQG